MTNSNESEDFEPIAPTRKLDLAKHLSELDEQRLAALNDEELMATLNTRRYLSDQQFDRKWKQKHKPLRRRLRFLRPR